MTITKQTVADHDPLVSFKVSAGDNPAWALHRLFPAKSWKIPVMGLILWGAFATLPVFGNTNAPLVLQDFTQPIPWTDNVDSTGIWRISGIWVATGSNTFLPSLAATTSSYPGDSGAGYLALSMSNSPALYGSEIQSLPTNGYAYGYYETRMKVSSVAGGCVSFFIIQAPNYGPGEFDYEFLLNEPWTTNSQINGAVHITTHPSNTSYLLNLPFNPTVGFHRYGMLWTPGAMGWYADGKLLRTTSNSDLTASAQMFIMANVWSGAPTWGSGPPTQTSTSYYDWIKFWPNVSAPPDALNPLTQATLSGGKIILNSTGWTPDETYTLLETTNVTTPWSNWIAGATGYSDTNGNISCTNAIGAAPRMFFTIRQ
jgi:hypothetical protein